MAYYSRPAISLSQPHSSSDDSSDHNSPYLPTYESSSKTKTIHNTTATTKMTLVDHHQQIIQTPSDNTPRRPRGRPLGSKNKPKPAIVITKDTDSALKPVVLEISAGADVIDHIINFARRNLAGISIMSASGSVSNVTLRQPISHAPSLSLHGPFNLLSLSGSYLTPSLLTGGAASSSSSSCCFGITLAGPRGQVFGGIVAGQVTAASQVVVVAATFSSPSFHSLPVSDETEQNDHHQQHNQEPKQNEPCSSAGKSMSVYGGAVTSPTSLNCQMSSDVMHWGPPSRPPY